MKEENIIEKKYSINIHYLNSKLNEYTFPFLLKDFKKDIIPIFDFSSNTFDKLNYIFQENIDNKIVLDFKTEESYKKEISKLKAINKNKDINIYIEKNNNIIEENDFEAHIKSLVQNEIKNEDDRIIQRLKYKGNKMQEIKIRDKRCQLCNKYIEGNMYKTLFNDNEEFYCENCSIDIQEPLFNID